MRILICEDEVLVAEDWAVSLKDLGCEVVGQSFTGRECIRLAEEVKPDLILIDINLKGEIDWIETVRRIRERPDIPVVYVIACEEASLVETGRHTNPYGFVTKPVNVTGLKLAIETALLRHQVVKRAKENERLLTAEVAAITKLKEIGELYVREGKLDSILSEILEAAIAFTGAYKGSIQVLDQESGFLRIVAQRGFEQPFLSFWDTIYSDLGSCGSALKKGERVVIEDVTQCSAFVNTPALAVQLEAGVQAVQSTPLMSYSGKLIGIVSTHWSTPHQPDDQGLRLLDLLARQAADIMERERREEALRESEEKFRLIFEKQRDAIFVLAPDTHKIVEANIAAVQLSGYTREELLQKTPLDTSVDPESVRAAIVLSHEPSGIDVPIEWHKKKDGTIFPCEIAAAPFAWRGRTQICATVRDVSRRLRAKEALSRVHDELEQLVNERTAELVQANEQLRLEILERKKVEHVLRTTEERYRAMFEGAAEGILVADRQTLKLKHPNKAVAAMFGYTPEELTNLSVQDIHPDQFLDEVMNEFQTLASGGKVRVEGIPCLKKDGTIFFADVSATVLEIDGAVCTVGFFSDITARKTAETELKRSESMLRAVLDQMPLGVTIRDAGSGKLILGNSKGGEVVGSFVETEAQFASYRFSRADGTKYRIDEMPIMRSMATGEIVSSEEVNMLLNDGSPRTMSISSAPVRDSEGKIIMGVGLFHDITDRKKAEAALRDSEERFRSVFESATEFIYIMDRDSKYTHVNPAVAKLFETQPFEIIGKGPEDLYGEETGKQIREINSRVLKGERIENEQVRIIGGTPVRFHDIRVPLRDNKERIVGICLLSRQQSESDIKEGLFAPPSDEYLSPAMQKTMRTARSAARKRSIVLLLGESGSGKDYLARWIHDHSPYSSGPFLSVNCAALPAGLAESELFGHERGAFTGANIQKKGQLEMAEGGTILLNEIGELELTLQAKLLSFLDTSSFLRVGGLKPVHVNARLIAATHRNLEREVSQGRFLGPLFYRLSVLPIEVPPLRERLEDLPILVNEIVKRVARHIQIEALPTIDESHLNVLSKYHWPGNVRELRNVLERSLILWEGGRLSLAIEGEEDVTQSSGIRVRYQLGKPLHEAHDEVTSYFVEEALHHTQGVKKKAAHLLGISRDSFYRYVRKLKRKP